MKSTPRAVLAGIDADRPAAESAGTPPQSMPELETYVQGGFGKVGVSASNDHEKSFAVVDENVGERLDHFELLDCIGVGGMGRVYRGLDRRLDRMVAVKVLAPELAGDTEVLRRFEQEAKAAARIDSPHFARVYFFGVDRAKHYIAMEFVEGDDLRRQIAQRGRMDLASVVRIGVQIARGLVHSERCGVVHRDIKPSNIIVTPEGVAKLVDMGLARNVVPRENQDDDITQAGVTLGTFDYISPEQSVDPRNADIRSDIYSLGCTLYHALVGQPPFGDGTPIQKLMSHQNDALPDLREQVGDVPEEFVEIVDRMTAKDPAQRYQTPVEMLADLVEFARVHGISLDEFGDVSVSYSPLRNWRDHLPWLGPILMVTIAAIAMAIVQRPRPRTTPPNSLLADNSRNPAARSSTEPPRTAIENPRPTTDSAKSQVPKPAPVQEEIVDVPAEPDGDLRQAIHDAKRGQVLRLLGTNYRLLANIESDRTVGVVIDKDLTIRGQAAQPTNVELMEEPGAIVPGQAQRSMFTVADGTLTLESIRLAYSAPAMLQEGPSYVIVENGHAKTVRCCFSPLPESAVQGGAVVRLGLPSSGFSGGFTANGCFFTAGPVGIEATGPGKGSITLEDCAFREIKRPLVCKGAATLAISLDHVSVFAGDAAVFDIERLEGIALDVKESVFSQLNRRENQPLVRVDSPGVRGAEVRVWWTGERNLYHGFESSLVDGFSESATSDFVELARIGFREAQSKRFGTTIWPWLFNDPRRDAGGNDRDAFRGFRLSVNSEGLKHDRNGDAIGVRFSPFGRLYEDRAMAQASEEPRIGRGGVVVKTSEPSAVGKEAKPNEGKAAASTVYVDPSVAAGDQPRGVFRSLATACEEAPDNGVIVLKGDREFVVSDLKLANKRVTVRSNPGSHAKLVLEIDDAQPTPRIALASGGELRLEDLSLTFKANTTPRVPYVFFEIAAGAALGFEGCQLAFSGSAESVLFGIRGAVAGGPQGIEAKPAQIVIRRCGITAMTAIRLDAGSTIRFLADDCRISCEQAVVRLDNNAAAIGAVEGRNRTIAFSQSTVVTRDCFLANGNANADRIVGDGQINIEVSLDRTAIVGLGGAPLARLTSSRATSMDQANLAFKGSLNFFAGFEVYLQVNQTDPSGMSQRPFRFAEWIERTQLDRDTNQQGEEDAIRILGTPFGKTVTIGPEELRRLGYRGDKFPRPPGVETVVPTNTHRFEPTK